MENFYQKRENESSKEFYERCPLYQWHFLFEDDTFLYYEKCVLYRYLENLGLKMLAYYCITDDCDDNWETTHCNF